MKGFDVPEYDLKGVKGKICTIGEVIILAFGTTVVKGIMNLMTLSKCLNVVVEHVMGYLEYIAMARSYGVLNQGEAKLMFACRNHSAKQITFLKQTAVEDIAAANIILALLAPKPMA